MHLIYPVIVHIFCNLLAFKMQKNIILFVTIFFLLATVYWYQNKSNEIVSEESKEGVFSHSEVESTQETIEENKKTTRDNLSKVQYDNVSVGAGDAETDYLYSLSKQYRECEKTPKTSKELSKSLESISNRSLIDKMEADFYKCQDVLSRMDQNTSWRELLIQAARNGHIQAKLEFGNAAPEMSATDLVRYSEEVTAFKAETMVHMTQARDLGSIQALLQLGAAYEDGILVEKDYLESYAHYLAYNLVNNNGHRIEPQRYLSNLTEDEILLAIRRSEIYAECCR